MVNKAQKTQRLLIVSNRLPIVVSHRQGRVSFQKSVGGLATGLASFYKDYSSIWIGWPGISKERLRGEDEFVRKELAKESCFPVFLNQRSIEQFYQGFCNKTIWPLFHYFTEHTVYNNQSWRAYKRVNQVFADEVMKAVQDGDMIWIHDFHLMLLPSLIRTACEERGVKVDIGFFLHIPFPSFEIFRLLPWRGEVLKGLLGADLIGFHTADYVAHFLNSVRRILGYEHSFNQILMDKWIVQADIFPLGIDYEKFSGAKEMPEVKREITRIKKRIGEDSSLIISVDRLDYTKGIVQRLEAFEYFLDHNPQYKSKVTFILLVVPSRTGVEHYAKLKREVDEVVGRINGKYDTIGWIPIWYLYRSVSFATLSALYSVGDIALITPLRDGMNLVSKEFVASKDGGEGVLILSEMAGASKEMGEALIVKPHDKNDVANAIKHAIEMSSEEKIERLKSMQDRLKRYDVVRWAKDFTERLSEVKFSYKRFGTVKVDDDIREKMVHKYGSARNRLIFLDYDGTLVGFRNKPEKAKPDNELLNILKKLTDDKRNEVIIVSGRDPYTLEEWLGRLPVEIIAEHGVWIKERKKEWALLEILDNSWKDKVRPILQLYADRTPGSFIEEKEFSLVWHYRNADPELSLVRARELKEALLQFIANMDIGVLEGNKVLEVKNTGINKGRAVLHWLAKRHWGFILCMGDDWTDEDMFEVMPPSAFSVKVGLGVSKAKYRVDRPYEVRTILRSLVNA